MRDCTAKIGSLMPAVPALDWDSLQQEKRYQRAVLSWSRSLRNKERYVGKRKRRFNGRKRQNPEDNSAEKRKELLKAVKQLPHLPGVYRYFDKNDKLLYVGKARDLIKRVSTYFQKSLTVATDRHDGRAHCPHGNHGHA